MLKDLYLQRKTNKMYALIALMAIGLLFASFNPADAQTQQTNLRLLTAYGDAEVRMRPDLAEVRLGVETEATTATQARQANAQVVQKLISALKSLGIPEGDIQTSTYQISPVRRFDNPSDTQGTPPIVGYNVQNIVSVRTSKLDMVPAIIDQSVKVGVNRVDSVDFMLKNDTAAKQSALRQAIADARANASEMAKELGVKLLRVYSVQQGGGGVIPQPVMFRSAVAESAATPILPGEVTVSASATLTYIIQ